MLDMSDVPLDYKKFPDTQQNFDERMNILAWVAVVVVTIIVVKMADENNWKI